AWAARAARTAGAFGAFWDPAAGAYSDTVTDRTTHPQDGNSFAVLARIPQTSQAVSALAYLNNHNQRDYGNTISDSASWDDPAWGSQSAERVYPFMSYYELLARFETGLDDSAFYLIRREWGYMLRVGPGTMWETIGPFGGRPTDRIPSFDAGWSSGAAPALTEYVLGIRPTSPGFATFTVTPHPGDLLWAKGSVSTPHGELRVRWELVDGAPRVTVEAPAGETWENAPGLTPKAAGVRVELGHGYSYLHPASAASRVSCSAARPHGTRIVLTAARWRLAVCFSGKRLAREALHGRFGGVVGYLCVGDRRRVGSLAQCR
ncbi:MAG: hypothetical protein H0X39_11025, partial [Actinobacteria bacterium]|nr:hypothetical protein [Actinomycetota bacterium]